jgi:hypothetical protein
VIDEKTKHSAYLCTVLALISIVETEQVRMAVTFWTGIQDYD